MDPNSEIEKLKLLCEFLQKELVLSRSAEEVAELKQQFDSSHQEPAPAEPEHPPFQLTGTLHEMASEVMLRALSESVRGMPVIRRSKTCDTKCHLKNLLKRWDSAVEGHTYTDAPAFWAHLLAYFRDTPHPAWCTKDTYCSHIFTVKGVTGRLGIPEEGAEFKAFQAYYDDLNDENKVEKNYVAMSLEECKVKLRCKDGDVLTTTKLQAVCGMEPPIADAFPMMLLHFFAFHGNREQDWCIGYGQENQNEYGYYDPEAKTMTLHKGKMHKEGDPPRVFKVHDKVASAIAKYHDGNTHKYLVPMQNKSGKCGDSKTIRKFLREDDNKKKKTGFFNNKDSILYIAPIAKNNKKKYIDPTTLRHLFETHIRYVVKMTKEDRKLLMRDIDHTESTALARYAQTYRPMVEWAEENQ